MSKQFFKPGDVVQLKQKDVLCNVPRMFVVGNDNKHYFAETKDNTLRGVRCRWFTTSMELQESTFNTKDLELVKSYNQ